MYIGLEQENTKHRFGEILNQTQLIAEIELAKHQEGVSKDMWISIISQIKDIREKIIEQQVLSDWEKIYERYSIGSIGLQCFDDNDEMQQRLCDIFYGAVHYQELSE